jgi:hypothetical protein
MKHLLGFFLFLLLATVLGCQRGDKQVYANVKGTVRFNGKPIEKGQIIFALEGRPPSTMDIVDGKFSGQAMVGSNKISVSAKKKVATAPQVKGGAAAVKDSQTQIQGYMKFKGQPGEFGGPPIDYDPTMVEYIPAEWGVHSTQMRVVEAGAANEFEFDIKGPTK